MSIEASTKLKNLIQPILVRWSNLYLGIPPLIKTRRAINNKNLRATIKESTILLDTESAIKVYKISNIINEKPKDDAITA